MPAYHIHASWKGCCACCSQKAHSIKKGIYKAIAKDVIWQGGQCTKNQPHPRGLQDNAHHSTVCSRFLGSTYKKATPPLKQPRKKAYNSKCNLSAL